MKNKILYPITTIFALSLLIPELLLAQSTAKPGNVTTQKMTGLENPKVKATIDKLGKKAISNMTSPQSSQNQIKMLNQETEKAEGPIHAGGGNTKDFKLIYEFIEDYKEHSSYKKYLEQQLLEIENKLPNFAALIKNTLDKINFYIIPAKLKPLPAKLTGLPFPTEQMALNPLNKQVFIDKDLFEHPKMTPKKQGLLFVSEALEYIILNPDDIANVRGSKMNMINSMIKMISNIQSTDMDVAANMLANFSFQRDEYDYFTKYKEITFVEFMTKLNGNPSSFFYIQFAPDYTKTKREFDKDKLAAEADRIAREAAQAAAKIEWAKKREERKRIYLSPLQQMLPSHNIQMTKLYNAINKFCQASLVAKDDLTAAMQVSNDAVIDDLRSALLDVVKINFSLVVRLGDFVFSHERYRNIEAFKRKWEYSDHYTQFVNSTDAEILSLGTAQGFDRFLLLHDLKGNKATSSSPKPEDQKSIFNALLEQLNMYTTSDFSTSKNIDIIKFSAGLSNHVCSRLKPVYEELIKRQNGEFSMDYLVDHFEP